MKNNHGILILALTFLSLIMTILYIGTNESLQRFHYIECDTSYLKEFAPETLEAPKRELFTNTKLWHKASKQYAINGTWSTLIDGYECKL